MSFLFFLKANRIIIYIGKWAKLEYKTSKVGGGESLIRRDMSNITGQNISLEINISVNTTNWEPP